MATINTDNHTIGQVDLYFEASVAHASLLATKTSVSPGKGGMFRTSGRNLGNIVTAELAPDVTYVDHFISSCGKRVKNKIAANTVSLTIPFTFDEINDNNLKRFFLASSLSAESNQSRLAVMEEPLIEGSAQMVFKTDVGTDMTYFIPKAIIRPDGSLSINDEDWWSGPMVLEVLYYNTGHYASKPFGFILASAIDC
jgi:hypothetical protein